MFNTNDDIFEGLLGGILYGLTLADLAIPLSLMLWSCLLFTSLKKVNCSDIFSALIYVVFCSGCGVILVLAIPQKYHGLNDFKSGLFWVPFLALISALRWFNHSVNQKNQKTQNQKSDRRNNG